MAIFHLFGAKPDERKPAKDVFHVEDQYADITEQTYIVWRSPSEYALLG